MIAVIGVGNEMRRDDGVGLSVAAEVARQQIPGVLVSFSDGEATRLLELWSETELTVVIDAVVSDSPQPGRIQRCSGSELNATRSPASSHAVSLEAVWRLGSAVGQVPRRLVIIGVEAADLGQGPGLSEPVARAVPRASAAVVSEIESFQKQEGIANVNEASVE